MESGIVEPAEVTHGKNPSIWHLLECLHFAPIYSRPPLLAMFLEPWKYLWDSHSLAKNVRQVDKKGILHFMTQVWCMSPSSTHSYSHHYIGGKTPLYWNIWIKRHLCATQQSDNQKCDKKTSSNNKIGFVKGLPRLINSACFYEGGVDSYVACW